jgi:cation diffusion facilitator CzcD-associated flavoprotein CzcO
VIVVGNSASGLDISSQICEVSQQPVIVSERSTVTVESTNKALAYKPEIAEFIPGGRKVRFSDGVVESDVDHIVFCTGYFYSFPFLQGLSPPVVTDGASALNLYQHCVYAPDPSLVFLGIPQRIVPFPVAEGQSAFVARLWAGRLGLPTEAELKDWELHMEQLRQEGQAGNIHSLKFPKDRNYINMLYDLSMTAEKRAELTNDGVGKIPPYWDEEKAWIRARFPLIKVASRALGEERHKIRELKQLGFDYEAEKEKEKVQTKLEDINGSANPPGHHEISAPPSVVVQS